MSLDIWNKLTKVLPNDREGIGSVRNQFWVEALSQNDFYLLSNLSQRPMLQIYPKHPCAKIRSREGSCCRILIKQHLWYALRSYALV
jgi:hypothetical protein